MPDVERVVAPIRREAEIVGRRTGFIGPVGITNAVGIGMLQAQSKSSRKAAIQSGLQRVVVIGAARGLVVDLGEAVPELTCHDGRSSDRVGAYGDDLVGDAAQKQVPALAADKATVRTALAASCCCTDAVYCRILSG